MPLLVVLVSWFVLGLAAVGMASILQSFYPAAYPVSLINDAFATWSIGFLAIVAFGFYMRVRHIRFR